MIDNYNLKKTISINDIYLRSVDTEISLHNPPQNIIIQGNNFYHITNQLLIFGILMLT